MNKKQKYIINKYFEFVGYDPIEFSPITDKKTRLSPMGLEIAVNLVIKILEEEGVEFG